MFSVIITEGCIAAQSFVFLLAGSESIAIPLGFTLYELTQNPQIQNQVHTEIDTVMAIHNNEWSYQVVKEMKYLDQVLQGKYINTNTLYTYLFSFCLS